MTNGGPIGDEAPPHDSTNGPWRFDVEEGLGISAHLVAVALLSAAEAPTHSSNGQRREGSAGLLKMKTFPIPAVGSRDSTCTVSHWFEPLSLRQVVDSWPSIAWLAGWLASDEELRVALMLGNLVWLPRGGAGMGGGEGDGGGGDGDGGGGEGGG